MCWKMSTTRRRRIARRRFEESIGSYLHAMKKMIAAMIIIVLKLKRNPLSIEFFSAIASSMEKAEDLTAWYFSLFADSLP